MVPIVREETAIVRYLFAFPPPSDKPLNFLLIETLKSVLTPVITGISSKLDDLLKNEHSVTVSPVNLLQSAYSASSFHDLDRQQRGFYKSHSRVSTFRLVCAYPCPVRLTLTVRVRSINNETGQLVLRINGVEIAVLPASRQWQTHELEIGAQHVVEGVNFVTIQWPDQIWTMEDQLRRMIRELDRGHVPEVAPSFGELHQFNALSIDINDAIN
jgi:hypothetical protein